MGVQKKEKKWGGEKRRGEIQRNPPGNRLNFLCVKGGERGDGKKKKKGRGEGTVRLNFRCRTSKRGRGRKLGKKKRKKRRVSL